jgi:cytochrome c2
MTFVLGLVSDPPAPKYIYKPDVNQTAWIKGRQALEKYNCGGCHVLEAERWEVVAKPGEYGEQAATNQYPYLSATFSPEAIDKSKKANAAGLIRAHLSGMPALNDADALPVVNDVEGDPVENDGDYERNTVSYPFELWQPTLIDGQKYEPGIMQVNVAASKLTKRLETEGGVLARYLLPHVTQREKQVNPAAKGTESWAWVPPPLVGEGQKVQSQWLHNFLLNPYPIRPAAVLRMPRFNMSAEEASDLAEYFARKDGAEFPYAATEHRLPTYLRAKEEAYQVAAKAASAKPASDESTNRTRLQDAMKMITNSNYCVKCHIVGDYAPAGGDRAKAPNLARIYERLRPGYLRDWIANPKRVLPYTSMPVNIPFDPADTKNFGGISQDLYHGTSLEQVDALVDLLMNYDNFAKDKTLVAPLVQQAAPPAAPEAGPNPSAASEKPAAGGGGG